MVMTLIQRRIGESIHIFLAFDVPFQTPRLRYDHRQRMIAVGPPSTRSCNPVMCVISFSLSSEYILHLNRVLAFAAEQYSRRVAVRHVIRTRHPSREASSEGPSERRTASEPRTLVDSVLFAVLRPGYVLLVVVAIPRYRPSDKPLHERSVLFVDIARPKRYLGGKPCKRPCKALWSPLQQFLNVPRRAPALPEERSAGRIDIVPAFHHFYGLLRVRAAFHVYSDESVRPSGLDEYLGNVVETELFGDIESELGKLQGHVGFEAAFLKRP